jgi:hypothetical protein
VKTHYPALCMRVVGKRFLLWYSHVYKSLSDVVSCINSYIVLHVCKLYAIVCDTESCIAVCSSAGLKDGLRRTSTVGTDTRTLYGKSSLVEHINEFLR